MQRTISDASNGAREWTEAESLLPQSPSNLQALSIILSSAPGPVFQTPQEAHKARLALYTSHFLSAWGQRAWEFTVGLVLLEIQPTSLFLVALFGLCDSGAQVFLGPAVGAYLDATPRLTGACVMYALQNIAVAISAAASLLLLSLDSSSGALYLSLVIVAIAAGSLSSVGASGATISVEREWTKTLSNSDSQALAEINAGMKRIDLTCLIASPILVGLIMTWHMKVAVALIVAYNLAVWVPERKLLIKAQAASPALRQEKPLNSTFNGASNNTRINNDNSNYYATSTYRNNVVSTSPNGAGLGNYSNSDSAQDKKQQQSRQSSYYSAMFHTLATRLSPSIWIESFVTYQHQPAAAAAFSLALLYFTVMSFGTLMTAYLKWRGMRESILSIYRGLGAVSGLLATVTYPWLASRLGLVPTGVVSVLLQLVCIASAMVPALLAAVGSSHISNGVITYTLVWGLVLSRFGLWSFDLAANQLIQEYTDSSMLGMVTGAQSSLQSGFQMAAYVAGVVVSRPESFPWLMVGSCGAVLCAAGVFLGFALRTRCGAVVSDAVGLAGPMTP